MCGGVEYTNQDKTYTVYFPNPEARLPVRTKSGELALLKWGRRRSQAGQYPQGGWARLESIHKGTWDKYFPTPVKIIVDRFMEKDHDGTSHWFDLNKGEFIQGLLVGKDNDQRIYVVTIEPDQKNAIHDRWPRIISAHTPD